MLYRPEIDGLRAIAVISVFLFHAGIDLFSGGFVGVDVFFVISGFLISLSIIEDLEKNQFSISDFYTRRARRILPALFFVMFLCIPFAWRWMWPDQMRDFSQSLIAATFFLSNILFWKENGYFALASEEKPLIHTWSLSVEEQFYIVFPLFMLLMWKYSKQRILHVMILMACTSLLCSELLANYEPSANFYLFITRSWELLAGAIGAIIWKKELFRSNSTLSCFGIIGVLAPVFIYDSSTPFPGLYTLIPVASALVIMIFSKKDSLSVRILKNKALVSIGLISYSAYLLHQPIFAFARITNLGSPSKSLMLILSLITLVAALPLWKFIEQPFRKKDGILKSKKNILLFVCSAALIATTIGAVGHHTRGFPERFPNLVPSTFLGAKDSSLTFTKNMVCKAHESSNHTLSPVKICTKVFNNLQPKVAVFGDSHAAIIAQSLFEKKVSFVWIGKAGCPPFSA